MPLLAFFLVWAAVAVEPVTYERLKSFGAAHWAGAYPQANVIQGQDGAFYGTTLGTGQGTIFKINGDGSGYTVLKRVSGGAYPGGPLVQGSDGVLYGTTTSGGANSKGTVFKIKPDGRDYTILRSFGGSDGANPSTPLVFGADGALYGTTTDGGDDNQGTVFRVTVDGADYTVLKRFGMEDGVNPNAGLVLGRDGAFYGTTSVGGNSDGSGVGTVFRMQPSGTGYTVLKTFEGKEGAYPYGGLVQDADGMLYGTTSGGGNNGTGRGTVFKFDPITGQHQILHVFTGSDGGYPHAGLLLGSDGALYGTTTYYGADGFGVVFKIQTNGDNFAVLKSLARLDGMNPYASLVQGSDGWIYGTAMYGGEAEYGTLFSIQPDGTDFTVIKHFPGADGAYPYPGLTQGTDGTLYGTTEEGGSGYGTIYRLQPDGTGYALLKRFNGSNERRPSGSLALGQDGALYGTTFYSGANNMGMVYKIQPDGTGYSVLMSFAGRPQGAFAYSGLVQGQDGTCYGTTAGGGTDDFGTIYRIQADGSGYAVLWSFSGGTDGSFPYAGLLLASDGALYGTTILGGDNNLGTIYRIQTDGSGFSVLKSLSQSEGAQSWAKLVEGSDGALYGVTFYGGANSRGTVFRIQRDATGYSVLKSFTGLDGANPWGGLTRGSDGALYGTTKQGGSSDRGTVFRIQPNGTGFTVLHSFGGGADGSLPEAALIQGSDGSLYGTTPFGGDENFGVVFRIRNPGGSFPPANDAFAQATVLSGLTFSTSGTTGLASREAGEPLHAGDPGGKSVWWRWTAPFGGQVTITTAGSTFDTLLAVYSGSELASLTTEASNDDAPGLAATTSQLSLNVTQGQTYHLAVDGKNGEEGSVTLALTLVPPGCEVDYPAPQLELKTRSEWTSGDGQTYVTQGFGVSNWASFPDALFEPAPYLPPCGLNANSSRAWLSIYNQNGSYVYGYCGLGNASALQNLGVSFAASQIPESIYLEIDDRLCGRKYRSDLLSLTKPDLIVSRLSVVSLNADQVEFSVSIKNVGAVPALLDGPTSADGDNVAFKAVISIDRAWDDAEDLPGILQPMTPGSMAPGEVRTFGVSFTLPAPVTTHPYLLVRADSENILDEGNEANNTAVVRLDNQAPVIAVQSEWMVSPGGPITSIPVTVSDDRTPVENLHLRLTTSNPALLPLTAVSLNGTGSDRTLSITPGSQFGSAVLTLIAEDDEAAEGQASITVQFQSPNDAFANRSIVTGSPVLISANNSGASRETDEPNHAGFGGTQSLWWKWVAELAGVVRVRTSGGSWKAVAIYTGSSLASLSVVASNIWDANGAWFTAQAGTEYQIAVDSPSYYAGPFNLSVDAYAPVVNDAFASRTLLSGSEADVTGYNVGATQESNEPNHANSNSPNTVWWTWTAPAAGGVEIRTEGSSFSTALAVYTGTALNALSVVASNQYSLFGAGGSVVSFPAVEGASYQIAVAGVYSGNWGEIRLRLMHYVGNVLPQLAAVPEQITKPGNGIGPIVLNIQDDQTPLQDLNVTARSSSPGFLPDSSLTLEYTGGAWQLSIAGPSNPGLAGVSIVATDAQGARAGIQFQVRVVPVNDAYADSLELLGTEVSATGTTLAATREPNEPRHYQDNTYWGSVWWRWTPIEQGTVVLTSSVQTWQSTAPALAVYTGSSLPTLSLVVSNRLAGYAYPTGKVSFPATAGQTYFIAVAGDWGNVSLSLKETVGNHAPAISSIPDQRLLPGVATELLNFTVEDVETPATDLLVTAFSSNPTLVPDSAIALVGSGVDWTIRVTPILGQMGSASITIAAEDAAGAVGSMTFAVVVGHGNDHFAERALLSGSTAAIQSNNSGASRETDEPNHAGFGGTQSLWWKWVAEAAGIVRVRTSGGSWKAVAIYTGSSLASLIGVASNVWDANGAWFTAQAGTEYQIAVDSPPYYAGPFNLSLDAYAPPANDAFANRALLSGSEVDVTGHNVGATRESNEPNHANSYSPHTVWWTWQAPATGGVEIRTEGSSFSTALAVYTGTALNALSVVASNQYSLFGAGGSVVSLSATEGTVYQIAVAGAYQGPFGDIRLRLKQYPGNSFPQIVALPEQITKPGVPLGPIALSIQDAETPVGQLQIATRSYDTGFLPETNYRVEFTEGAWRLSVDARPSPGLAPIGVVVTDEQGARSAIQITVVVTPPNDLFADAEPLVGSSLAATGTTRAARRESNEPPHSANYSYWGSVWWRWTPTDDGTVVLTSSLQTWQAIAPAIAVYTGTSLPTLAMVASNSLVGPNYSSGSVAFQATANQTYSIAVAGEWGNVTLALVQTIGNHLPTISSIPEQLASPGTLLGPVPFVVGDSETPAGDLTVTALSLTPSLIPDASLVLGGTGADRHLSLTPALGMFGVGTVRLTVQDGAGTTASTDVRVAVRPANDAFARRIVLPASDTAITADNTAATRETGEPNHAGPEGGASLWWSWTAPETAWFEISTHGSAIDTLLAVYTGDSVSTLGFVAANDQSPAGTDASRVRFRAQSGTAYAIAIDGRDGQTGPIALALRKMVSYPGYTGAAQGVISAREYRDITGTSLSDLTNHSSFPNDPSLETFAAFCEWPAGLPGGQPPNSGARDYYGVQIRGFFVPQVTGTYHFAIAADDNAALYLSTDDNPARKVLIASEPGWNPVRWFDSSFNRNLVDVGTPLERYVNRSRPIDLVAGRAYYLEALMKEGGGGDNLAVAVQIPGARPIRSMDVPIPGELLATFEQTSGPVVITSHPADATAAEGGEARFAVSVDGTPPYEYQWLFNEEPVLGATHPTVTFQQLAIGHHLAQVKIRVSNALGTVTSSAATLRIDNDNQPPQLLGAVGDDTIRQIRLTFSEPLDTGTANASAHYSVDGGLNVLSATLQPDGFAVLLETEPQTPGESYTVTVNNVKDRSLAGNVIATDSTASFRAWQFLKGTIRAEYFFDISGSTVANLRAAPRFPHDPSLVDYLTHLETPRNFRDNYGVRLRGWIEAPVTGDYRFYLASDDGGQLWLSPDEDPSKAVLVAQETTWSSYRGWAGDAEHESPVQSLEHGRRYFFEALMKEGSGGDHLSITWRLPGAGPVSSFSDPIPNEFIYSWVDPTILQFAVSQQPQSQTRRLGEAATFRVSVTSTQGVTYQWQRGGVDIPGAREPEYTLPGCDLADDGARFSVRIVAPGVDQVSDEAVLTVLADNQPPTVISAWAMQHGAHWEITVMLSEPVSAVVAEQVDHYSLTDATVAAARYLPASRAIVLRLEGLSGDGPWPLQIAAIEDLVGNRIENLEVAVQRCALKWAAVGGQTFGFVPAVAVRGPAAFDLFSGGFYCWDVADEATFVYEEVTGDFDKKVRVLGQDFANYRSGVGLMAREVLNENQLTQLASAPVVIDDDPPFSRNVRVEVRPTRDVYGLPVESRIEGARRVWSGSLTENFSDYNVATLPVVYPDVWLRLKREGNTFTHWRSNDGEDWRLVGTAVIPPTETDSNGNPHPPLPESMYVGVMYCPDNNTLPADRRQLYRGQVEQYGDVAMKPVIVRQPVSASTKVGGYLALSVTAEGSPALAYRWYFKGSPLAGATSRVLELPAARLDQAGAYHVVVQSPYGTATSEIASVTISAPTGRVLSIGGMSASPGTEVELPVRLAAQGDEQALGFSVNFDETMLTYLGAEPGIDTVTATRMLNENDASHGRVGVLIQLPLGTAFSPGTRHVLTLRFRLTSDPISSETALSFGDVPVQREISSRETETLFALYQPASVGVSYGFEADVAPRPNGNNPSSVTVTDWVQVGRFAAGLDTAAVGAEFQRADCAPRLSGGDLVGGDGRITVTDWVQAGRYAAGLDPLTPTLGPTGPTSGLLGKAPAASTIAKLDVKMVPASDGASDEAVRDQGVRVGRGVLTAPAGRLGTLSSALGGVTVRAVPAIHGDRVLIQVMVEAPSPVAGLGFSLAFDASALQYRQTRPQEGGAAVLLVNAKRANAGLVGIAMAMPAGQSLVAGTRSLLEIEFTVINPGGLGSGTGLVFTDAPVYREVVDVTANVCPATWVNGAVSGPDLGSEPESDAWLTGRLSMSTSAEGVLTISWPSDLGAGLLESSPSLGPDATWSRVMDVPAASGTGAYSVRVQAGETTRFYRLRGK